jgi:serine/threonine protein kinase
MSHTMLGRYRILGELGRGAMGTVYRALDPLIEREVAIKTLHPNLPEEVIAEVRPRFLREARSAGQLNHPNIVTIFDVGEQDGVAYMAMELLEGRSLQDILGEPARLPFQTTADYVSQIADALDRAQQLGVVHRDVKPANVVVSASGHVKLTDFGVAYIPSSTMTQTGTMIGSPRYMSPEQVLGLPIDPRSDIFSLGVVLYEMLTGGRAPFVREGDTTIFPLINRIAAEPHPPVTQMDPTVPAGFDAILCKALAKKPEERYQRAGEMANDLRSLRNLGPAGVAPALVDAEKTLVLAPGPQKSRPDYDKTDVIPPPVPATPTAAKKGPGFVLDLDTFSRNFESEEQARLQAEQEARRKKEEDLHRWGEEQARKREAFERESEAQKKRVATGTETGARRGALDMLKQKAATRIPGDDPAEKKAKADLNLDQSLRSALRYLAEVARELNGVNPVAERPYDYFFLGRLPPVKLSNSFVDLRSIKIDGEDRGNHLFFRFRVQPTAPAKSTLLGADITRFQDYLKMLSIPHEVQTEARSDFGQATRATFTVAASLPCEINIRADYDKSMVEIELVNVRRPGRVRCRLEPKALDAVVDDLARYLLGVDDDFDKVLNRR